MYHYRDKNKVELDIVLQDRRGGVVERSTERSRDRDTGYGLEL